MERHEPAAGGSSIPRAGLSALRTMPSSIPPPPGTCMCSAASARQDLPCRRCGGPQSASTAASEAGRSRPPFRLPGTLLGVAVFRSWLFVVGGANSGNQAVATVYRARIQPDGTLGSWEAPGEPPGPLRLHGTLLQFADALYMVGGDGGTSLPGSAGITATQSDAIFTCSLDLRSTQVDGSWSTNPSSLIKRVAKHTALLAGGTVLVSGGVYNGAGNSATEHQYATINLDGTFGSFQRSHRLPDHRQHRRGALLQSCRGHLRRCIWDRPRAHSWRKRYRQPVYSPEFDLLLLISVAAHRLPRTRDPDVRDPRGVACFCVSRQEVADRVVRAGTCSVSHHWVTW